MSDRFTKLHYDATGEDRERLAVTVDRYGCGAKNDRQRRACALYLFLLGDTTTQLMTDCRCRHASEVEGLLNTA